MREALLREIFNRTLSIISVARVQMSGGIQVATGALEQYKVKVHLTEEQMNMINEYFTGDDLTSEGVDVVGKDTYTQFDEQVYEIEFVTVLNESKASMLPVIDVIHKLRA